MKKHKKLSYRFLKWSERAVVHSAATGCIRFHPDSDGTIPLYNQLGRFLRAQEIMELIVQPLEVRFDIAGVPTVSVRPFALPLGTVLGAYGTVVQQFLSVIKFGQKNSKAYRDLFAYTSFVNYTGAALDLYGHQDSPRSEQVLRVIRETFPNWPSSKISIPYHITTVCKHLFGTAHAKDLSDRLHTLNRIMYGSESNIIDDVELLNDGGGIRTVRDLDSMDDCTDSGLSSTLHVLSTQYTNHDTGRTYDEYGFIVPVLPFDLKNTGTADDYVRYIRAKYLELCRTISVHPRSLQPAEQAIVDVAKILEIPTVETNAILAFNERTPSTNSDFVMFMENQILESFSR